MFINIIIPSVSMYLFALVGLQVADLHLEAGQHLRGEGEELRHLAVRVPRDHRPVPVVVGQRAGKAQLERVRVDLQVEHEVRFGFGRF